MSLFESLETRSLFSFGVPVSVFGANGTQIVPGQGAAGTANIEAVTQSDGKILIGTDNGLSRLTSGGALDGGFGTAGVVTGNGAQFRDTAVDASGRIYVLGYAGSGTLITRYSSVGRLDTAFGTNGSILVEKSKSFSPRALAIQSDGKLVVAGTRKDADAGTVTRVYRLTTAGTRDSGFGSGGVAEFSLAAADLVTPQTGDSVVDLRVLASGKIEVLGSSYNYLAGGYDDNGDYTPPAQGSTVAALARLTSAGQLDSSFGSNGVIRRAAFDNQGLAATAGSIRADGSATVTISNDDQSGYFGFTSSGKSAFTTYAAAFSKATKAVDATALPDSRIVFTGSLGSVWFVSQSGVVSNVVTPFVEQAYGTTAVVATAGGDAVLVRPYSVTSTRGLSVTEFDAGKITDPRPDDLPASGAVDTAVDANGGLHVAFFDTASSTLKYAYRNAQGFWTGIKTVDATAGAGANISLTTTTIKDRTNVAIAYYDSGNADLKLASSNTNGRKFAIQTVATKGAIGINPSLQYTDSGGFAVTYYSKSTKSLYYSLNNGDGWATDVVDTGGAGQWNDLQFDPTTRKPAVAYSGPNNTVMYAFKGKGLTWAKARQRVATTAGGAAFVNLAISYNVSSYGLSISYYDLSSADLVLASLVNPSAAAGKRFSTKVIASRGSVGAYNAVTAPTYLGSVVYGYSRNADSVFAYDTSYGNITTTRLVTGGGKNLSVAFDSYDGVAALAYTDTATGLTLVR